MKNCLLRFCLFLISTLWIFSALAQESDGCLNLRQIQKIYDSELNEYSPMLIRKGFIVVSRENDISIPWDDDTLLLNMHNWQYSRGFNNIYINIFSKDNYHNCIEYNSNKNCATQLQTELTDSLGIIVAHQQDSLEQSYTFNNGITLLIQRNTLEKSNFDRDDEVMIKVFNEHEIQQLAYRSQRIRSRIDSEKEKKKNEILQNLADADSLAAIGEYATAINILESSYNILPEYVTVVDRKLSAIKNQYKTIKIQEYTAQGNDFFKEGNYASAADMFQKVLKEDLNDRYAKERLEEIKKKIEILNYRGIQTYSYKESNPENFEKFAQALSDEVNRLISKTDYGKLRFNFSIIFDTAAINQSFYELFEFETPARTRNHDIFMDRLSNLLGHSSLKPGYKEGIPIRSMSVFNVKVNWESHHQTVIKKKGKIINKSSYYLDPLIEMRLLTDSMMTKGEYTFLVKSKTYDANIKRDISLTKYHTVGGEAFFYGLIPGLGTLIATQGKEGAACMATSLICYGGATAALILYNNYGKQLRNQAETLNEEDAKKMNTKREICKWSSLGGFCIGGVIHFSGMIKAMVRGIQNKKASKELRKALREEPIIISTQNINLK